VEIGCVLAERYEIVRPLAEGAMSTVWVARDRKAEEDVAIKAISLDAAGWRAEVRDRFMKEARLLALGKHDHLVGVRDVGETDDGFLYLVLDLLDGETLADRIAREPRLSWREASNIALGIARGVAALHRAGIVHRDLKPANIVLHHTPEGLVPKIIDLGISKVRAAAADPALCATLTATGQVLGTPQYMSHEQALGEPDVDVRSDVWALGVILYEMLGRRRPFEAPNANAVLAAIRRKEAPPLSEVTEGVPASLARIVERCLQTDRAERFSDASEFSDALDAVLKTAVSEEILPVEVPKATAAEEAKPLAPAPQRRSRYVLAAVVVFVLGASFTMGVILFRKADSPPPAPEKNTSLDPTQSPAPNPARSNLPPSPPSGAQMGTSGGDAPPAPQSATKAGSAAPPTSAPPAPSTTRGGKPLTQVNEAGF
jgi:eukaryotic-like serine/threonine-protein kinase